MNKKKGLLFFVLISLSILLLMSGCNNKEETKEDSDKITIYTTLFVLADFSQRIGGEHVEVINLIPAGVSSHDYEPTAKEMAALSKSDLFIYNGVGMERWLEKIIMNIEGENVTLIDASQGIEDSHHDKSEASTDEENEHEHSDSHVWLNPLNALKQAEEIKNSLIQIDLDNTDYYQLNYEELKADLLSLDNKYRIETEKTNRKDFFVSHAAFGYLAEEYGLNQHPISGINPTDEPSLSELEAIIKKTRELDVKYILVDPMDSTKISKVLAEEIGAEMLEVHTIGNLTEEEANQGLDYVTLMERNLEVFKKALNE